MESAGALTLLPPLPWWVCSSPQGRCLGPTLRYLFPLGFSLFSPQMRWGEGKRWGGFLLN